MIGLQMLRPSRIMLAWLRTRSRGRLFVLVLLCSPVVIPFLFFTFPILCAAEFCLRLRGSGCWKTVAEDEEEGEEAAAVADNTRPWACEQGYGEGCDREVGLLQRYLEDQLRLVGSVDECVDDFDWDVGDEEVGHVGFLHTNRSPLLV